MRRWGWVVISWWGGATAAVHVGKDIPAKGLAHRIHQNQVYVSGSLVEADFRGATLRGVTFAQVNLKGANFTGAVFEGVRFLSCDLGGASFQRVRGEAEIIRSSISKISFHGAGMRRLLVRDSHGVEPDFAGAVLGYLRWEGGSTLAPLFQSARIDRLELERVSMKDSQWKGVQVGTLALRQAVCVEDHGGTPRATLCRGSLGPQLLTDVVLMDYPRLTTACLKTYPVVKPTSPMNGPTTLFDGREGPGIFRPCLKEYPLKLDFTLRDWPKELLPRLDLHAAHNGPRGAVTLRGKWGEEWRAITPQSERENATSWALSTLPPSPATLNFAFPDEATGITELKIGVRR